MWFLEEGGRYLSLSSGCCGGDRAVGTQSLRDFPTQTTKEPAQIAGGANEIILKTDFGTATVAGVAQAVTANQFALGPLDGVTPTHSELELRGFHLATAGLQKRVMFADDDGAMRLL